MIASSLRELQLDKYHRLVEHALGENLAFTVYDRAGIPVWSSAGAAERLAEELLEGEEGAEILQDTQHTQLRHLKSGERLLYKSIRNELDEYLGAVAVLVPSNGDRGWRNKVKRILEDVAVCILHELRLTSELDNMASELSARYEELNLVYSLEEQPEKYDPGRGRQVMAQLVEDCVNYLDVDSVVLAVPGERLEVQRIRQDETGEAAGAAAEWPALREELFQLVWETRVSVVLNDALELPALARSAVKAVAAPILDARSQPCGLLTTINAAQRPDFSNGDRKLLEVLAEQASTVLQASRDLLTGLLNRRGFEHRLHEKVRGGGGQHVLLYLDIDRFKVINDTCGQAAGDELLRQMGELLEGRTRREDVLARLGDDEFAILLSNCAVDTGVTVAQKLVKAVGRHRFNWEGEPFDTTASVGVVSVKGDGKAPSDILSTADTACHVAKQQGRNRVHVYHEDDYAYAAFHREMQWVPRINRTLQENRLRLYAQLIRPISDKADGHPHCEILVRLLDESGQMVRPGAFIPAAERYQLTPAIDRWVIRNTLEVLRDVDTLVRCSINVSGQSFSEPEFLEFVLGELKRSGIASERICFEITETAAVSNYRAALRFMAALTRRGCKFALDDFGEGVSSFSSLKRLPVHYLKIDGSFIKDIDDPVNYAMVDAINRVGHVMGLLTTAEFVEDERILLKLQELGVDYGQGYAIGMPCPLADQLEALRFECAPPITG